MISSQKKIIFLDRDGVINKEVSYLFRREDFIFMENIFKSCRFFQNCKSTTKTIEKIQNNNLKEN
jgi:histidinol phosphatase-like enzyme